MAVRGGRIGRGSGERGIDDAALGDGAAPALADQLELLRQPLRSAILRSTSARCCARDRVDRLARALALVGQVEQLADLLDREAEVARAADEAEPAEVASVRRLR